MNVCSICKKENVKLCGKCGSIYYCGSACQKIDWKKHKSVCVILSQSIDFIKQYINNLYQNFKSKNDLYELSLLAYRKKPGVIYVEYNQYLDETKVIHASLETLLDLFKNMSIETEVPFQNDKKTIMFNVNFTDNVGGYRYMYSFE